MAKTMKIVKPAVRTSTANRPNVHKAIKPAAQKPAEVIKEAVKPAEEPVKNEPEKPSTDTMVFQPISMKHRYNFDEVVKPETKAAEGSSKSAAKLDDDAVNSLIDMIVDALCEKFVTKDEIETVVEHTLQKMVVENDVNKKPVTSAPVVRHVPTKKPVKPVPRKR